MKTILEYIIALWQEFKAGIIGVAALAGIAITTVVLNNNDKVSDTVVVPGLGRPLFGLKGNMLDAPISLADTAFADSLKSLGITVISVPGTGSNEFNWRTGQTDSGRGKATTLQSWKAFYDRTGIKLLIGLNIVTHSIPDQIEMLDTMYKLGIPIETLELGNELNNVMNEGHWKYPTASIYRDSCKALIDLVRQKPYSKVQICCVGSNKKYSPHWNDTVMTSGCNALSIHMGLHAFDYIINDTINYFKLDSLLEADWNESGFNNTLPDSVHVWCTEYNWRVFEKDGTVNYLSETNKYLTTLRMTQWLTAKKSPLICARWIEGEKQGAFTVVKSGKSFIIKKQATGFALETFFKDRK